jgi:MoaA/NifB/PqqE/SkfB family radical SAM enzyme
MNDLEKKYREFEEKLGFYFGRAASYPLIPPEHVYFPLTNRCNLRCQMCDISKNPSSIEEELSTDKIKEIIAQIKDMGIKHIIFSGGEPLLRQDLFEIIQFSVEKSIEMVDLITNGMLLNDDIIQRLIKLKLNHITISLDGLEENNDSIRGRGVFKNAENNIDKFNFYKSKYNSGSPTIGINFTIMDKNINDILPMVDFARGKGCNLILFQPILFNNTKMYEKRKNILWLSPASIVKLEGIIQQLIELKDESGGVFIYTDANVLRALPGYFEGKRPAGAFKCYEGIKRIVITYNGKLWSCLGIYGDLKTNRLQDIWLSKEAQAIRDKAKKCKEHCLQDCVYFPSNIKDQLNTFLKMIDNTGELEGVDFKNRLVGKIKHYIEAAYLRNKKTLLNISKNYAFDKEIKFFHPIIKKLEDKRGT